MAASKATLEEHDNDLTSQSHELPLRKCQESAKVVQREHPCEVNNANVTGDNPVSVGSSSGRHGLLESPAPSPRTITCLFFWSCDPFFF